jgi:hypothetical protein
MLLFLFSLHHSLSLSPSLSPPNAIGERLCTVVGRRRRQALGAGSAGRLRVSELLRRAAAGGSWRRLARAGAGAALHRRTGPGQLGSGGRARGRGLAGQQHGFGRQRCAARPADRRRSRLRSSVRRAAAGGARRTRGRVREAERAAQRGSQPERRALRRAATDAGRGSRGRAGRGARRWAERRARPQAKRGACGRARDAAAARQCAGASGPVSVARLAQAGHGSQRRAGAGSCGTRSRRGGSGGRGAV